MLEVLNQLVELKGDLRRQSFSQFDHILKLGNILPPIAGALFSRIQLSWFSPSYFKCSVRSPIQCKQGVSV